MTRTDAVWACELPKSGFPPQRGSVRGSDGRTVGDRGTPPAEAEPPPGWTGAPVARSARRAAWDPLGASYRSTLERPARPLPAVPDLPSPLSTMVSGWNPRAGAPGAGSRPRAARQDRSQRVFYRWHLQRGEKGGFAVGKTKRGKGTKVMAIADRAGLPIAARISSASPHEVTLVEATLDSRFVRHAPERLIGDCAYDSNGLDDRLRRERGIELIAPHQARRRVRTQDGRPLRRYRRRWKVERLFAWLQNYRRLVTRYERHAENFLGFLYLGCICILLRHF